MSLSFARGGGAWKDDAEFSEFAKLSVNAQSIRRVA